MSLALYYLGPPGGDHATHLYQTELFEQHGWQFWHTLWYGGHYSQVNYSLTFYPLATIAGMGVVVAAGVAAAAAGFAVVARRQWPKLAAAPTIVFATTAPLAVVAGTYPFLVALAPALFTLVAVQHRRPLVAGVLAAITAATHPLAFGFLVATLICVAVATRGWWRVATWRVLAVGVGLVTVTQAGLTLAFSAPGVRYPFDEKDALAIGAFCVAGIVLTHRLADQRALRGFFAAYAVLSGIALVVSSPVGGNVVRLMLVAGAPLLMLPLAARSYRPMWLTAPLLAGVLFWQVLPAVTGWSSAADTDAAEADFWRPVDAFLAQNSDPGFRVEVVATVANWEAYYVARRGVALARGWYRQYDWPQNEVLYENLSATDYEQWLRRMGVRYVLLPDDALDAGTDHEVAALRGSQLSVVEKTERWTVYELADATPIATPASTIRLTRMTPTRVDFVVNRAGRYEVRQRYTPYWRVTRGGACVESRGDFGMTLVVIRSGPVALEFDPDLKAIAKTAVGRDRPGCPE